MVSAAAELFPIGTATTTSNHEEITVLHLQDIVVLAKRLRDTKVLSVYVNAVLSDPAEKNVWRKVLEKSVAEARERVRSQAHEDRAEFEAAVERLYKSLPDDNEIHSSKGWVAFCTPDETILAQPLHTSVPNIVAWENGIRVSPLFRAIKQLTPIIVVLADSRSAQIHRYVEGHLEHVDELQADAQIGPVYHMGDTPRAGFHAGVRGTTGTDEAERVARAATARLHRDAVERAQKLAGEDAWLLIGGTAEACSDLENILPGKLKDRAVTNDSLHMRSRPAEISVAARAGASELRARTVSRFIDSLAELAGARGRGAVGVDATDSALKSNAVQTLLFSPRLMETKPDLTESLVRQALLQGADVEQVNGEAARKLDEEYDGIAARLRFVREVPAEAAAS